MTVRKLLSVLASLALLTGVLAVVGVVTAGPASAAPDFKAPWKCGDTWNAGTYDGHGNAIDFAMYSNGANVSRGRDVLASAAGTVINAGTGYAGGLYVNVDHGGGWVTVYYHFDSLSVKVGAKVAVGAVLGKAGSTGAVSVDANGNRFAHLHFEERYNGVGQPVKLEGKTVSAHYGWVPSSGYGVKSTNSCTQSFKSAPAPTISGIPATGNTLTAETGSWSPAPSFTYQWRRNGSNISGATGKTHVLTPDDALQQISVAVTGTKAGYVKTTKASGAIAGPDVDPDGDGIPGGQLPPGSSVSGSNTADIVGFGHKGIGVQLSNGRPFDGGTAFGYAAEAGGWRLTHHPRFVADVNGDRKADILGFANDGVYVALNKGPGFAAPAKVLADFGYTAGGWRIEKHPRMLADVNRDGRPDIVGFANAGVVVSLNNGNGTFAPATLWSSDFGYDAGGWRVGKNPRQVVDVNGDGLPDIVGFANAETAVALNTGSGFATPKRAIADFDANSGWRVDRHPRVLADVNGDKRPDIVGFGDDAVFVALNRGDGTFAQAKVWSSEFGYSTKAGGWRVGHHPRFVTDMNGDGRADLVGFAGVGVRVSLSTGSGFAGGYVLTGFGASTGWRVDRTPRTLVDVNRDGYPDIVGFANDDVWRALNKGDGTFADGAVWVPRGYGYNTGAGGWNKPDYLRFVVAGPVPAKVSSVLHLIGGKPYISGKKKLGKKLKVSPGVWSAKGVKVRYQWLRNGKPIPGATKATYKLKKKDRGKRISVRVTASKPGYTSASATSPPTPKIKKK